MKNWLVVIILLIVFLSLRLVNLLSFPLYLDEGIYLFWAKLVRDDLSFAYVSLQDGKTPLFIWLLAAFQPFIGDYLLTGRLISVIAGFITALSWVIITRLLFNLKQVIWFCLILLVVPLSYFIERLAFVDSVLLSFASLSLLFLVSGKIFLEKNSWGWMIFFGVLSGLMLALAYFTKTSAKIFLIANIIVGICWIFEFLQDKKIRKALILVISFLIMYLR